MKRCALIEKGLITHIGIFDSCPKDRIDVTDTEAGINWTTDGKGNFTPPKDAIPPPPKSIK